MRGCFESVKPLNRFLRRRSAFAVVAVVAWASGARPVPAQTLPPPSIGREARPASGLSSSLLVLVTSDSIDRERSYQLREGVPTGQSLLLRSSSSLTARLQGPPGTWR